MALPLRRCGPAGSGFHTSVWRSRPCKLLLRSSLAPYSGALLAVRTSESLLKRQAGVKDSGQLLPGGIMLDRGDARLAVLPTQLCSFSWSNRYGGFGSQVALADDWLHWASSLAVLRQHRDHFRKNWLRWRYARNARRRCCPSSPSLTAILRR